MKKINFSPLEIIYLMHLYAIARKYDYPSPAIEAAKLRFLANGLVEQMDNMPEGLGLTEKGFFLVKMICATPLPVKVLKDPRD